MIFDMVYIYIYIHTCIYVSDIYIYIRVYVYIVYIYIYLYIHVHMIVVPMCVAQLFANTHIIQASRIRGQSIYYQVYLNDLDDGPGS